MFKYPLKPIKALQEALRITLFSAIGSVYFWGLFRIMGQAVSSVTCAQAISSFSQPIKLPFLPVFTKLNLIPGLKPESVLWFCNYASVGGAILSVALLTAACAALIFLVSRWNPQRSFYRARLRYKISRIQELALELTKAIELTDDPDLEEFFTDGEIQRLKRISKLRGIAKGLWNSEIDGFIF